jgi:hypothetical protein
LLIIFLGFFFFFEQKFSYSSLITKRKILDPQKGSREK